MSLVPTDPAGVAPLMRLIDEIEATLGLRPEVFELPSNRYRWGYADLSVPTNPWCSNIAVIVDHWSGEATRATLFVRGSENCLRVPNVGWDPVTGMTWQRDPAAARRQLIRWIAEKIHFQGAIP